MARMPKRDKSAILTRTERWELKLSPEQEKLIVKISDGLRDYYNYALQRELEANEAYQAVLKADSNTKPNQKRFLNEIDIYNLWKEVRQSDAANSLFRAKVPANWVLETFKAVIGAYKSFFTLVKNGDYDARPPKLAPEWLFQAIPGCSAFSVKNGEAVLAPEIFGRDTLVFKAPAVYQQMKLAKAVRIAKFIIKREPRDLRQPGRYWLSLSYETNMPETLPFVPEDAVYVALGASYIGVVSPSGNEIIPLWRSDKHWKPKTDSVGDSLGFKGSGTNLHPLIKGSKKWRKLHAKRRKMFDLMAKQQTQDRREVVKLDLILRHGVHFVITDLVVRSQEGKLADADQPERGGSLGLNWQAQNTGSIGYLADWLEEKVREYGGTARRFKLSPPFPSENAADEKKIPMARKLRDDFLTSLKEVA